MRILHVTECFDGGVSKAIETRAKATPDCDHILLYSGADVPDPTLFRVVKKLNGNHLSRISQTNRFASEMVPDVIHAHSSWAGFYCRITKPRYGVAYEPHCFKFTDPTSNALARAVYLLAEKLLASRTAAWGALTESEIRYSKRLNPSSPITLIPNVSALSPSNLPRPRDSRVKRVGMIGRIAPQKDPFYFAELVEEFRRIQSDLSESTQFVWIGDGVEDLREIVLKSGAKVTGWLNNRELEQELDEVDVYVHTASYEGFPISVLDAAERGLPILARRIDALEGMPLVLLDSPRAMATKLHAVLNDPALQKELINSQEALRSRMSLPNLERALSDLYNNAKGPV